VCFVLVLVSLVVSSSAVDCMQRFDSAVTYIRGGQTFCMEGRTILEFALRLRHRTHVIFSHNSTMPLDDRLTYSIVG